MLVGVEPVFKALADPTRRELLDELFRHDGQTLGALAGRFAMTRVAPIPGSCQRSPESP